MPYKVSAIVGATAVGKSDLAMAVATELNAEIVSIDSMQIYRGMDIGTAKPDEGARAAIPHHLLDVFDPSDDVSVADFQRLARAAVADITERGRLPLLVGGSGLYHRAVVDELRFPPRSPEVRSALEAEIEESGSAALYERLRELDPVAAERIEPSNARRIVRALEVIQVTGSKFSANDAWDRYESIYTLGVVGLTRPREILFERIERRVDAMLDGGLLDEVGRLKKRSPTLMARQALGYRQILESPGATQGELRAAIVRATKRLARRQESWFRSDPRVVWFDAEREETTAEVVAFLRTSLALT
ncbi:MAG: tRNA (adenosine(37)-N6)-dimethylallyltransferase MiaA [Actinomycetota bacterium]|nr:tRNA (adenosine(37)-N6)-dimethylallyltransferase MiaA [Actinomycetota bacterium]